MDTTIILLLLAATTTISYIGSVSDMPYHLHNKYRQHSHRLKHYRDPGAPSASSITPALENHHASSLRNQASRRRTARLLLRGAVEASLIERSQSLDPLDSHIVDPVIHGADPTGTSDSSSAFAISVAKLISLGGKETPSGLIDLGGATLDLGGGIYRISSPINIPQGYANLAITRGTLFASENFSDSINTGPGAEFLLRVGDVVPCNKTSGGKNNKNCNSDITIGPDLTFDGKHIARGCIAVLGSMDVNVGPSIMCTGYRSVGITLADSGAGYVHNAWLGQYAPGDPAGIPRNTETSTATAILLDEAQHDSDIVNVIIFSGLVGVNSSNGANRIQGVHTWNLAGALGGYGIILHTGVGRVQQCYLDYAPLLIRYPTALKSHLGIWSPNPAPTLIEENLFLGSSTIILAAAQPFTLISGLVVTGNSFHTQNVANKTFVLDESKGNFAALHDSIVENNEVDASFAIAGKVGTRSTMSRVLQAGISTEIINFSKSLLFDFPITISEDTIKCFLLGGFPSALSAQQIPNTKSIRINLASPIPDGVNASVTCTVDQSIRTSPAH